MFKNSGRGIEEKRNYWNKRYSAEGEIWGRLPSETCVVAAEAFKQMGVNTLMVPGCGYGRHSNYLSSIGFNVLGFDVSDIAISLAKEKKGPNVKYMNLDVLELSSLSERFDAIYSFNLIHLFKEEERQYILESFRQHLKGPSILAFTTFSTRDIDFGKGTKIEYNIFETKPGRPVHFYNESELRAVLRDWEIIELIHHSECEDHGNYPHTHSLWYCLCKVM
ncbi:MAG: methyltransferase domain-containing protein [Nitrospirae bacterium]|nr:methyltransferase domain-containing protein [Nitrospirota bacterium]